MISIHPPLLYQEAVRSFVSGPLQKNMLAGGSFTFPAGDVSGARYGRLTLSEVTTAGYYTAWYHNHNPLLDGFDPENKTAPIDVVSDSEYWEITGPAASSGHVTLRWDATSNIIPADAISRNKLRVVEWNLSWMNRGNGGITGDQYSGTIKQITACPFRNPQVHDQDGKSSHCHYHERVCREICDDGSFNKYFNRPGGNTTLDPQVQDQAEPMKQLFPILPTPYILVVSNAIPALASGGPGIYSFTVSYIRDATGTTGIRDFETAANITLHASPVPSITGLYHPGQFAG